MMDEFIVQKMKSIFFTPKGDFFEVTHQGCPLVTLEHKCRNHFFVGSSFYVASSVFKATAILIWGVREGGDNQDWLTRSVSRLCRFNAQAQILAN